MPSVNKKNGKVPGEDRVLNEMPKSGKLTLSDSLCKIFNVVFASERYSYSWCKNLLVPVFKSGIPDNPDNYRGISIGSCIGKVYSMVLFNRLIDAIDNFNLLSKNQIGFLQGYRTADHSFTIISIADHFVKTMKQDMHVAFVDLRKAFDTVNRKALINKLYKKGITGKFLKSIKTMHAVIEQKPKINHLLLPTIVSDLGLKQGDNFESY